MQLTGLYLANNKIHIRNMKKRICAYTKTTKIGGWSKVFLKYHMSFWSHKAIALQLQKKHLKKNIKKIRYI